MWLAIDCHACPAMCDHLDVCSGEMRVGFDEVGAEDAGEELRRSDWVFLGFDVDSILHRIGCYYDAVVCFGVSGAC